MRNDVPLSALGGLLFAQCLFGKPSVVSCCAFSRASTLAVVFKYALFASLTLLASAAVDESSGRTLSAISQGAIVITDEAGQLERLPKTL